MYRDSALGAFVPKLKAVRFNEIFDLCLARYASKCSDWRTITGRNFSHALRIELDDPPAPFSVELSSTVTFKVFGLV